MTLPTATRPGEPAAPAPAPAPVPAAPPQPAPAAPPPQPAGAPEGYIEKARYDGLVRKVEELTLDNRKLTDQLAAQSSEIEQLKGQLAIKDTEKTVAVGERDNKIQTVLQENATLQAELTELRGLKLKVKVINDLKRPELLRIADKIPNLQDEEALKIVMQDFAGFADDLVKQREQQLLSGVTPPLGPGNVTPSEPESDRGWQEKINGLPLGSPERQKAMDDYGDWLIRRNTPTA
jgi:hypothetical protein